MAMEGVCIVISPLLALMQDQVENLHRKNIKAIALNKPFSQDELIILFDNIQFTNVKFLYLSPERLQSKFIQEKIKQLTVSLIAIDEAHCISEWGHDFRPSYLELKILNELCPGRNTIALTATATPKVLEDISTQLHLKNPHVFQESFNRENLAYQLFEVEDKIFKIKQILTKIHAPTIIYTDTRNETKRISTVLNNQGFSTTFYHGGLNTKEKDTAYTDWFSEKKPIIIATNAFGMGIDKPNIRVVIHVKIPNSIENYLQEAGRAGRDEKKAFAVMLLQKNDLELFKKKHAQHQISIDFLKQVYFQLNQFYAISRGELTNEEFNFEINDFCASYKLPYTKVFNALNTLVRYKIIAFTQGSEKRTAIQFLTNSNTVLRYCDQYPSLDKFISTILRTYGGGTENSINLNEFSIAKKMGITVQQVIQNLKKLETDEIIKYQPSSKSANLCFLVPRDDNRTINAISKSLLRLQQNKNIKASAMVRFIEDNKTCRSKQLLKYFKETTNLNCGICDVCINKKKSSQNKNKDIQQDIVALLHSQEEINSRQIVLKLIAYKEIEILSNLNFLVEKGTLQLKANRNFILSKKNN